MRSRRLALGALAAALAVVGGWAQFWPASFYRSFPAGRAWVAADGPFNEHLIRDVGGLNLALCVLLAVAAWRARPELIRLAGVASLVYGLPHLAYHATHLNLYGTVDAVGNVVALAAAVVVPAWLAWSPEPRPAGGPAPGGRRRVER